MRRGKSWTRLSGVIALSKWNSSCQNMESLFCFYRRMPISEHQVCAIKGENLKDRHSISTPASLYTTFPFAYIKSYDIIPHCVTSRNNGMKWHRYTPHRIAFASHCITTHHMMSHHVSLHRIVDQSHYIFENSSRPIGK